MWQICIRQTVVKIVYLILKHSNTYFDQLFVSIFILYYVGNHPYRSWKASWLSNPWVNTLKQKCTAHPRRMQILIYKLNLNRTKVVTQYTLLYHWKAMSTSRPLEKGKNIFVWFIQYLGIWNSKIGYLKGINCFRVQFGIANRWYCFPIYCRSNFFVNFILWEQNLLKMITYLKHWPMENVRFNQIFAGGGTVKFDSDHECTDFVHLFFPNCSEHIPSCFKVQKDQVKTE